MELILYGMTMLFVLSTMFSLIFITNVSSDVISRKLGSTLCVILYLGYMYIISALTDNSFGMVMMAYVPALLAIFVAELKIMIIVVFCQPLVNVLYLFSSYSWSGMHNIWISVLISWGTLIIFILSVKKIQVSKKFYYVLFVSVGLVENYQSIFYPSVCSEIKLAMISNIVCYVTIVMFGVMIHERLELYDKKVFQAIYHDTLTGVCNFKYFSDYCYEYVGADELTVGVIDIDKFKYINDTLGHDVGNQLVKLTADVLVATFEKYYSDTEMKIFRFGGEEFIITVKNESDYKTEMLKMKDVLNEANTSLLSASEGVVSLKMNFSGGVTSTVLNSNLLNAFKKADSLLYEMKTKTIGNIAVDLRCNH